MSTTEHNETASTTQDPGLELPEVKAFEKRWEEATLFVKYPKDGNDNDLVQRSYYRQVVLRHVQPRRDNDWTWEDVDRAFEDGLDRLRAGYIAGKFKFGLTKTLATLVFERASIDYVRKYGGGPDTESLSAPIKPSPKTDSGGAAATVEESIAGPREQEPQQQALLRFLSDSLQECIAELPARQLGALRLRELLDYDVRKVNPDLINTVLDLTDGISFSAHTSAFEESKRTLKRKLVDKLGHTELADLLHDLDISLDLDLPRPVIEPEPEEPVAFARPTNPSEFARFEEAGYTWVEGRGFAVPDDEIH